MAIRLSTWDPRDVSLAVAGQTVEGFAPGRMIEYELDAPVIEDAVGVDGEPARWARTNPFGTVRVHLSMASPSNKDLNVLLLIDRVTLASIYPLVLKHQDTTVIAGSAWLKSQPRMEYSGGEPSVRVWEFRTLHTIHDIRGLDETPAITL